MGPGYSTVSVRLAHRFLAASLAIFERRLLQLASEARATGRHAVADQFTERAAELLDQIVSEELAKSSKSKR